MHDGHDLELETWKRRAHFELFRGYEQPFFNICAEVEVSATRQHCRAAGHSFSLATWFVAMVALNRIEAFRYRLRDGGRRVWVHERIHVGTTILNADETFSFCYFPHFADFRSFQAEARARVEALRERARSAATLEPMDDRDDMVHGSTLPWVRFTSVAHARRLQAEDSTPKLVFGRLNGDGPTTLPVSIEAHHALVDGLDAGKFFGLLEKLFQDPAQILEE